VKPETPIKTLIWIYALLLIFEGSLRKWVLPSYSNPLLVVRDPVVIAIYLLALAQGRFPFNGWVVFTGFLALGSLVGSFLAGQDNLIVTAYGLRTNYLHLPLIWVMASVLTRRDVENLGKTLLLLAIPMTALMVWQFKSPPDSYINRGVGVDEGVAQLYGALGHIRPPGFFSFITGPNLFYPLVTALLLHQFKAPRRLWWPLLGLCGFAVVLAMPISISRTALVASLFVGAAFAFSLFFTGFLNAALLRLLAIGTVVVVGMGFLPVFDDAREAFLSRWETAATGNEVGVDAVTDRVFGGGDYLAYTFSNARVFGVGIGMGSNVAAQLTTGRMGFTLAENEWAKCVLELGLLLGAGFLALRLLVALSLLRHALRRLWHQRDPLPWLVWSAAFVPIMSGQWAQPTSLGFAVLGGGLCCAACQDEPEPEPEDEPDDADLDTDDADETAPADDTDPAADDAR
jgi:hypothetical protein